MDRAAQAQRGLPARFSIRSKATSSFVNLFPRIRGSALLVSTLLRALPLDPIAVMEVSGKDFELDLKHQSQLGIIVGRPEILESSVVLQCLQPGDVFFDIGSNWGYYTFLAAAQVGAEGLVVSAEADPSPFSHLLRIAHSAALTNVLPLNVAVSSVDGEQVVVHRPWYRADTAGFIGLTRGRSSSGAVTTRTLDRLRSQVGRPVVRGVKIDVEGFEPLVVRGGRDFLGEGVSDFALVEISKWSEERGGVPCSKVYEMLYELGFEYAYAFEEGQKLMRVEMRSVATPPADKNVIFFKRGVDLTRENKESIEQSSGI